MRHHLYILWDESHIWGLLAARAARVMGLATRLARGPEIAGGLLKDAPPAMLLIPGGNARHKAGSLGAAGGRAIQDYVAGGGQYLGFCGGAGLALSWKGEAGGLALCPWQRAGFDERMQHFMSGHLHMSLPGGEPEQTADRDPAGWHAARHPLIPEGIERPALPVWWPGRFDPAPHPAVTVLASYDSPAKDFWLADLPIASLPEEIFDEWQELYGFSPSPAFLRGQPCLVHGLYGGGSYTLSYSHLETPQSPEANRWLAHIFRVQAQLEPRCEVLPSWNLDAAADPAWEDPVLDALDVLLREIVRTGLEHGLLFTRTSWLLGWRAGLPGAALNNLRAALGAIRGENPSEAALAWLRERKDTLRSAMESFHKGCIRYLLAERLSMTLAKSLPDLLPPALLKEQRAALFGPPMRAGGLYRDLIHMLDELAWMQY